MSWLSDAWDWVKGNKDIVEPILQVGSGILNQSNADSAQSQYLDYLRQRELQNYQTDLAAIQAYNAQLGAGGGRRSGGGNAAAIAAARQTEENRQKAARKANRKLQQSYKQILNLYAPFRDTANTLLPGMTETYQKSLGLQRSLADYLNRPEQMAKLEGSIPAWQVQIPLPEGVKLK